MSNSEVESSAATDSELTPQLGIANEPAPKIDMAVRPRITVTRLVVTLATLGFVAALPYATTSIQLRLATLSVIWFVAAIGLHVLLGQAGLISIGQAAFVGVGAYTSALLSVRLGWPFWITLPLAALVPAIVAFVVGLPTMKLRSHYLAIATVGVGEIAYLLLINLSWLTNGADGVVGIPRPVATPTAFFYLTVAVAAVVALAVYLLRRSPVGLAFHAVRTDELAASSMGVSITFHTMLAFVTGAICAGIAGSLFAHFEGFISPSAFALQQNILLLTMVIIGGAGYISGALVGATLITILPNYLRAIGQGHLILYGAVVLAMILFAPQGIVGLLVSSRQSISRVIARIRPTAGGGSR